MKIWRMNKSTPHLTRKKKYEFIFPTRNLTFRQKLKYRSLSRFFSREFKRSILNSSRFKALNSLMKTPSTFEHNFAKQGKFIKNELNLPNLSEGQKLVYSEFLSFQNAFLARGALRLRKLKHSFAIKERSLNRIRLLYGMKPHTFYNKLYKHSQKQQINNKIWKFATKLESLPYIFLNKCGWNLNAYESQKIIKDNLIINNGQNILLRGLSLSSGDLVSFSENKKSQFYRSLGEKLSFFSQTYWQKLVYPSKLKKRFKRFKVTRF